MEQRHVPTEPWGGGGEEERQGWYSRFNAFIVRLNDALKLKFFVMHTQLHVYMRCSQIVCEPASLIMHERPIFVLCPSSSMSHSQIVCEPSQFEIV